MLRLPGRRPGGWYSGVMGLCGLGTWSASISFSFCSHSMVFSSSARSIACVVEVRVLSSLSFDPTSVLVNATCMEEHAVDRLDG